MRVVDHPDRQRLRASGAALPRGRRLGQPRPVGEGLEMASGFMFGFARHNRSAPVAAALLPQRKPAEPAIGEQQHPRLEPVDQLSGEGVLRRRVRRRPRRRTSTCVPHSASATTRACGNAARSPLFTPGRPNHSSLSARVGHVQTRPVDRHQPPPRQPRTRRVRLASGSATRRTAPPSARTPTAPGLKDRRLRRQPTGSRHRRPRQPVGQQRQHVLIRALRVQRHPDREVRHHPRRQRPMPLLSPPRLGDHLIHHRRREHPRQHPHRHQIRQPTIRLRLPPTRTRHPTKLHRCNTN